MNYLVFMDMNNIVCLCLCVAHNDKAYISDSQMQCVYNSWNSWKSWKSPGIYWTSWKFLCKVIDRIGCRS